MNHFLENKDHIINKLANLTSDQKEEVKLFFQKHPSYESKIDWNDKSLSYEDFESILALDGKSKTQAKKRGIEGLVEGVDYEYLGCGNSRDFGNYTLYQPLTYLGSKTLASNKVPPVKARGAQWCIAYQKTDQYWKDYTNRGIQFVFILTEDTKYAVVLYSAKEEARIEIYGFEDEQGDTYLLKRNPELLKTLLSVRKDVPTTPEEWLEYYISEGLIIRGKDGTYRNSPEQSKVRTIDATRLITDSGRLVCDFDRWEGDFKFFFIDLVSSANIEKLKSLEGCPKTVIGNFRVNFSQIESLEGGPIFVSGDYDCASNPKLVSFKGAPEAVGGDFNTLGSFYAGLQDLEYFPKAIAGAYQISATNVRLFLSQGNREKLKKYPQIIRALKSIPEENISRNLRKELLELSSS